MTKAASQLIKERKNFIKIEPTGIHWGFNTYHKLESDGLYSWYIPSFDIYFSSSSKEKGDEIALDSTKAFFEFWLKKQSFRKFVLQIIRLGYQASSFDDLKNLLQRKNLNADLIGPSKHLPHAFKDAESRQLSASLHTNV